MQHPYDNLVSHLRDAIQELRRLGLGESLAKGRVGEILLAHYLGHELVPGDKGSDGRSVDGKIYEYKVSVDDQYNFNFGHAGDDDPGQRVEAHFAGYEGAYCGLLTGGRLRRIVYCSAATLVPYLKQHLATVTGKTWQKNFIGIESFARLPGAQWVLHD